MCLLYEYLYGETEVKREELSDHLEKLLEVFPETEDSRMDKEFEVRLLYCMVDNKGLSLYSILITN